GGDQGLEPPRRQHQEIEQHDGYQKRIDRGQVHGTTTRRIKPNAAITPAAVSTCGTSGIRRRAMTDSTTPTSAATASVPSGSTIQFTQVEVASSGTASRTIRA